MVKLSVLPGLRATMAKASPVHGHTFLQASLSANWLATTLSFSLHVQFFFFSLATESQCKCESLAASKFTVNNLKSCRLPGPGCQELMRSECNTFPAKSDFALTFSFAAHGYLYYHCFALALICLLWFTRTSNANRMLHFPLGPMEDKLQPHDPSHCTVNTLVLLLTFHAKHMWM